MYRLSTTAHTHQFSVSYSGRSPRNLPICDFSSPPSTLSFRSVASHSIPSSFALPVRPCSRARCCDIQEGALVEMMVVSWHPCRVAVVVVVVVITAIHFFSSVWHFWCSAPVVGTFV